MSAVVHGTAPRWSPHIMPFRILLEKHGMHYARDDDDDDDDDDDLVANPPEIRQW